MLIRRSLLPLALALLIWQPALAQVQMSYYDVQGADYNALLGALNSHGPCHGRADWKISYKYQSRKEAGGCKVSSLTIDLELLMTLPRWTPPAGASADLVSRWERYIAALRVHEDGHLDHGRNAAREFQTVSGSAAAADCGALDGALRQRFARLIADYQARDRAYDARTEHGKTQGAWFR